MSRVSDPGGGGSGVGENLGVGQKQRGHPILDPQPYGYVQSVLHWDLPWQFPDDDFRVAPLRSVMAVMFGQIKFRPHQGRSACAVAR